MIKCLLFGHKYTIHLNSEEMWLECSCGFQLDIPENREEEAYEKIRNRDWSWDL